MIGGVIGWPIGGFIAVEDVTPPTPTVVSGGEILQRHRSEAPGLSRKKFEEIWEAMAAAQERAKELKSKKAQAKLKKVGDTAQFFLNVEQSAVDEEIREELLALERALEAAASAKTLSALLNQTEAALDHVNTIRRAMDEEEMLALLLVN